MRIKLAIDFFNNWNKNTLSFFFQSYISSADKQFVASTIQAIGRCASNISEVTDTCLAGLVRLLSNRDGKKRIPLVISYHYCSMLVKQRTLNSCLKEKDTEWINGDWANEVHIGRNTFHLWRSMLCPYTWNLAMTWLQTCDNDDDYYYHLILQILLSSNNYHCYYYSLKKDIKNLVKGVLILF